MSTNPHVQIESFCGKDDSFFARAREEQARVLWDLRIGEFLKIRTFEKYLQDFPKIPDHIREDKQGDPHHVGRRNDRVFVVDPRIPLDDFRRLLKVRKNIKGQEELWEGLKSFYREADQKPYWLFGQDGTRNRGRTPIDCIADCYGTEEIPGNLFEGLALYAQDRCAVPVPEPKPGLVLMHAMDCSGSFSVNYEDFDPKQGINNVACLGYWKRWHAQPSIRFVSFRESHEFCGTFWRRRTALTKTARRPE